MAVEAIITAITQAFEVRQAAREAEKAKRAARLDAEREAAEVAALQKERILASSKNPQIGFSPSFNVSSILPVLLIGGVAVVGVVLLKR